MKKIGLYGGAFDPVHIGHLITSRFVLEKRKLDKIIFIPAYISPFKKEKQSAPAEKRMQMLNEAIEDISFFEVSNYEINKKTVSYTYETIRYFRDIYKNIELIIGYDNLVSFEKWKNPDEIVHKSKLVVMKRSSDRVNEKNRFFEKADLIETPVIDISSTEIRERVSSGLSIDFLVPDKVKDYIIKNSLYK